ncbi:hypothetical protein NDU88_009827 [Pleurodeles waltl]|uniref:Uncharacterized protein n=1 Tax=Pleurodeles waltl TaxID=8319 RepID=A0AAV7QSN1_PLEWA|nr:hypothetical protein NDU88_009827 [Pleurodeles waltl]
MGRRYTRCGEPLLGPPRSRVERTCWGAALAPKQTWTGISRGQRASQSVGAGGGAPIGPGDGRSDVARPAGMNLECDRRESGPIKREAPSQLSA